MEERLLAIDQDLIQSSKYKMNLEKEIDKLKNKNIKPKLPIPINDNSNIIKLDENKSFIQESFIDNSKISRSTGISDENLNSKVGDHCYACKIF